MCMEQASLAKSLWLPGKDEAEGGEISRWLCSPSASVHPSACGLGRRDLKSASQGYVSLCGQSGRQQILGSYFHLGLYNH